MIFRALFVVRSMQENVVTDSLNIYLSFFYFIICFFNRTTELHESEFKVDPYSLEPCRLMEL